MANSRRLIITIDGPAGSGKSTTARLVAHQLGYLYLDSGALYRAVTLAALREAVDMTDAAAMAALARRSRIELRAGSAGLAVFLQGEEVTETIRHPEVSAAIGPVAANAGVRAALLEQQRQLGQEGGIVAEGRDMGSVVFPQAELKIFLVASIAERARRRQQELAAKGISMSLAELEAGISKRDRDDSSREVSPLIRPPGALELDTTALTVAAQVETIVGAARELLSAAE